MFLRLHADVLTQGTETWRTRPPRSHLEVTVKGHPAMSSKAKVHTPSYCKLHRPLNTSRGGERMRDKSSHDPHPRKPCTEQDSKTYQTQKVRNNGSRCHFQNFPRVRLPFGFRIGVSLDSLLLKTSSTRPSPHFLTWISKS